MNNVYLMKDEKRNYCLFKVGFTSDLLARMKTYASHNPEAECISVVKTQARSQRFVEKLFHEELKKKGYSFVYSTMNGNKTEWFKVSYEDDFYTELCEKGLNAFKCGKNRKNHGDYNSAKGGTKVPPKANKTMQAVMEKYGDKYDYTVIDDSGWGWDFDTFSQKLYAIGECGWTVEIEEIKHISKVEIAEDEKCIYMYIGYSL